MSAIYNPAIPPSSPGPCQVASTSSNYACQQYFFYDLAKKNIQKPSDARIILIFQSLFDPKHACSDPCDLFALQDFAETHFIDFKIIFDRASDLRTLIEKNIEELIAQKRTGNIAALIISAHGMSDAVRFGSDLSRDSMLTVSDIHAGDFDDLPPDTAIILHACHAGLKLGPAMAAVSGPRPVMAAMDALDAHDTWLQYSKKDGFSMHSTRAKIYTNRTTPPPDIDHSFLSRRFIYVENLSHSGHIDALCCTGFSYLQGKGTEASSKKAAEYFEAAAILGSQQAQLCLTKLYHFGYGVTQSDQLAVFWAIQAILHSLKK
jgi:hypothetical protein